MRKFVIGLAVLAFGATLTACSSEKSAALAPVKTDPAAVEKRVADLAAETFVGTATAAADVAAVRDALPSVVSLSWDGLTFDNASRATMLTAVKLTPAEMPDVGIGIDELRLWDFDADFAKARLAGLRIDETARLARRIELKGVRIFGIETLMAPAMEAYADTVQETIQIVDPGLPDNAYADMSPSLDSYDFSISRIVIDDLMLRPYELTLAQLPPDHEFAEAMPVLQPLAAVMRLFAADTVAAFDFNAEMAMRQMGQAMNFSVKADTYGLRGLRGGDNDAGFMTGLSFDMAMPTGMTDPASGVVTPPMNMTGGLDYLSMQDVRFDKLYSYLAKGEWPPRTDADLLSYGLITYRNGRIAANGHNLVSVGETSLDARGWHWFVPARARFQISDLVYDIRGLTDFAASVSTPMTAYVNDAPVAQATPPVSPPPIDPAIMQLLTKYGLDKPSIDLDLGWDWNADTGAAAIDTAFGLDNYMRFDIRYEGGFPSFDGVSALIPGGPETADGEAIGALFESASTLKKVEFNVIDEGGLDRAFAFAAEAVKTLPPEATGGVAVFANATPQGLRQTASAAVYMIADQAELQAPGLKALLAPFGAFIDKGGKVELTLQPKTPLQFSAVGEQAESGELTPAKLLEQLNGKTVHTPPPAATN